MIPSLWIFAFSLTSTFSFGDDSFPPVYPTQQINFLSKEDQIEIGDRIQFEVTLPENLRGSISSLHVTPTDEEKDFFISETPDPSPKGFRFRVAPKKAGDLVLKSLQFKDDLGKVHFESEPKNIRVNDLKNQKPPEEEPETLGLVQPSIPKRVWIFLVLFLVGLCAAGYLIVRHLKKRKQPAVSPQESAPPVLSPEQIAFREITKIFHSEPFVEGKVYKALAFRLTEILKDFLKHERNLDCDDLTTKEWLHILESQHIHFSAESRLLLQDLMAQLDPQKFIDETHAPRFKQDEYEKVRLHVQRLIELWRRPL